MAYKGKVRRRSSRKGLPATFRGRGPSAPRVYAFTRMAGKPTATETAGARRGPKATQDPPRGKGRSS